MSIIIVEWQNHLRAKNNKSTTIKIIAFAYSLVLYSTATDELCHKEFLPFKFIILSQSFIYIKCDKRQNVIITKPEFLNEHDNNSLYIRGEKYSHAL